MNILINPGYLSGTVHIPQSKSHAHRLAFCAAAAGDLQQLKIENEPSADVKATLSCLEVLSALQKNGASFSKDSPTVFCCGESGTTLRFLLPFAMTQCDEAFFLMDGRLSKRPLYDLQKEMEAKGCEFSQADNPNLLHVRGRLNSGEFYLPGDVSSQYISGLLLALPLLKGDSKINIISPIESAPYITMTLDAMSKYGVKIQNTENAYDIPGGQVYTSPKDITIEGDWSAAAFFIAANALGSCVKILGLDTNSVQGDKAMETVVFHNKVDVSQIPDLVPALAAKAAATPGVTILTNAARLRLKESDRLQAMSENLRKLGILIKEGADFMEIHGGKPSGGRVKGFEDHRIVMAMAILATVCQGPVIIEGGLEVAKSYPNFFNDFSSLGGNIKFLHQNDKEVSRANHNRTQL